jgi:hypothetical protein
VGALAACAPSERSLTGIVVTVDGNGPASVNAVTVRSSEGQVLTFDVGRLDLNNGLPAAHLREHLASGAPIVVEYVVEGDRNVLLRYNDAPTASPSPSSSP